MIDKTQLNSLVKKFKINETTVLREYLQVWFLQRLYSESKSKNIYFKGGTAIHLIYKAPRFSEDLDFTVNMDEKEFLKFIEKFFSALSGLEPVSFKQRKVLAGFRFLLTCKSSVVSYPVFINLDFSFREMALKPEKSIIETDFPIIFNSYIYHLSAEEMLAEKVRAILSRKKGRDIYDLWYLLNLDTKFNREWILKKLEYYKMKSVDMEEIVGRINGFGAKQFVLDMRPFVPINEKDKLESLYAYICDYIKRKLKDK
ncbi:nucleotidyl transferase AbiEii/AbiGii toxin family protein [Patescibacteria group bacterium]|nr:nucleotidyl transferase AbiEii/AbiGii toxin family protein [Patescibacteria group bacterium]MCG2702559.1 nucleotidyl transferase AbiEii/AbiGii toxin family protein [Candidatus Parcubacteria bacterium]MBU4265091.1 nucleotidyl transferase AbiEii/AbiGii toxin family protein [Patescibacteria group bacterium]MBU4389669.1 nucleotidyl transferase AbiEii/AbiGii toxin family protein [Patescibacteria group bacterium]MBU4396795.1 nucleotidyl transferase AbiEii/AbiGii toxin family protein [Patescibacter